MHLIKTGLETAFCFRLGTTKNRFQMKTITSFLMHFKTLMSTLFFHHSEHNNTYKITAVLSDHYREDIQIETA